VLDAGLTVPTLRAYSRGPEGEIGQSHTVAKTK